MRNLFNQDEPEQAGFTFPDVPAEVSLLDKYAPKLLSDIIGQRPIVDALQSFVAKPYSTAFMFAGPTGVGKSSTARALARALGIADLSKNSLNFEHVMSGTANAETIETIISGWRFPPWGQNAWRLVLVDEADLSTPKALQIWLSALENLPPRTVVVFTTNNATRFDQRTIDRFQVFTFTSDDVEAAQKHADNLWYAETGSEDGLPIDRLPNVVIAGEVSIRRLVQAVQSAVRDGVIEAVKPAPAPVRKPRVSSYVPAPYKSDAQWSVALPKQTKAG